MNPMAKRVSRFGTTIFTEMTALANEYQAVNLGQGVPDFPTPPFLRQAAANAIEAGINQYAPGNGRSRLRTALADKMARVYGLSVDPDKEIIVMQGATEAIFATIMGLIDPGDEVIVLEPCYDSYVPSIIMAGGIPRYYTLRPPDWAIKRERLATLFTPRTRLILLNTPHNPTGKLFGHEELTIVAELCQQHDVIAVVDEVYEHIVFDGRSHLPLATLPGMANRTVTISSLGKTFNATGWKVGWAIAAPEITQAIFRAHQFITFCGAAPLQEAAAAALSVADEYYTELREMYQRKRDMLVQILTDAGIRPFTPQGTYFIMADISQFGFADDISFCRYLTTEIGVAAIPPGSFYHNPADGAHFARFAFCKTDAALEEAAKRLQKLPH
ncbi:MAG: aminotransferase class I/II-fold pyridoxal phosphate-dependent enzyme [Chloroflexi bacterium]|nr:MAG: aminotransferase class I/II-fold pyridoxal phosphate-dependent enzyme [Chloroflexota bacterium]